ncbi:uncharacterized protein LOC133527900 [Cydia pomonella]|uniref:uncharacterized protein LOC133527900 n=1 Tax=Cydia pomonella TaxID=82600 RepID=UPI002ADDFB07|nr:uncharacterized protein LOC133527900 [Cydia pomonella]
MEMKLRNKRLGPLPGGDRRGTPGADAGCLSMRTVSGEELNRRAPSGSSENATANQTDDRLTDYDDISLNSVVEPYSPSTASYIPSPVSSVGASSSRVPTPDLDVAQEANAFMPASTKAGKTRVRMSWSKDVNLFIMRTYYYITKLETDMTTYRKQLHELFSRQYPTVKVSEQRVSDQKRAIIRNKLLSDHELARLKDEVQIQLNDLDLLHDSSSTTIIPSYNQTQDTEHHSQNTDSLYTQSHMTHASTQTEIMTLTLETDIEVLVDPDTITEPNTQAIFDKFQAAVTKYSGMDPASRPKLPKLKYSNKLTQFIY